MEPRRTIGGEDSSLELRQGEHRLQVIFPSHTPLPEVTLKSSVSIEGVLQHRPLTAQSSSQGLAAWELVGQSMTVLNLAQPLAFHAHETPSEEEMLKHRHLSLRWQGGFLKQRHAMVQAMRQVLESRAFTEVETHILVRNTPGGAQPYLVPVGPQSYALAQSPQLWKQLLICGGLERYYQLAHCFRNEGSRPERQPEFSQFEIEMAFVTEEEIRSIMTQVVRVGAQAVGVMLPEVFPTYTYAQALSQFGSEKPHLGISLRLESPELCMASRFEPGTAALTVPEHWSESYQAQQRQLFLQTYPGLSAQWQGSRFEVSGPLETAQLALGKMLKEWAEEHGWIQPGFYPAWITHFPMFECEEGQWQAAHHPFTRPQSHTPLTHALPSIEACAFDLAFNGYEVGGGSLRLHEAGLQRLMFERLGWSVPESEAHFGYLLRALETGAPPHGGMALGVERLCAVLLEQPTIRSVMPFPKTNTGQCPLTQALS